MTRRREDRNTAADPRRDCEKHDRGRLYSGQVFSGMTVGGTYRDNPNKCFAGRSGNYTMSSNLSPVRNRNGKSFDFSNDRRVRSRSRTPRRGGGTSPRREGRGVNSYSRRGSGFTSSNSSSRYEHPSRVDWGKRSCSRGEGGSGRCQGESYTGSYKSSENNACGSCKIGGSIIGVDLYNQGTNFYSPDILNETTGDLCAHKIRMIFEEALRRVNRTSNSRGLEPTSLTGNGASDAFVGGLDLPWNSVMGEVNSEALLLMMNGHIEKKLHPSADKRDDLLQDPLSGLEELSEVSDDEDDEISSNIPENYFNVSDNSNIIITGLPGSLAHKSDDGNLSSEDCKNVPDNLSINHEKDEERSITPDSPEEGELLEVEDVKCNSSHHCSRDNDSSRCNNINANTARQSVAGCGPKSNDNNNSIVISSGNSDSHLFYSTLNFSVGTTSSSLVPLHEHSTTPTNFANSMLCGSKPTPQNILDSGDACLSVQSAAFTNTSTYQVKTLPLSTASDLLPVLRPSSTQTSTSTSSASRSSNSLISEVSPPPQLKVPTPNCKMAKNLEFHGIYVPLQDTIPANWKKSCVAFGRLPLLLDLDNTLLHAVSQLKLSCDIRLKDFIDDEGNSELYKFTLPAMQNNPYYLKLRPYVRGFLTALHPYYELSIYTNATKEYADVIISLLDPTRELFADRIIARDVSLLDSNSKDQRKEVARLYPNFDSRYVVAFDDRKDVWSDIPSGHIVKAEIYEFFDSKRSELVAAYPLLNKPKDQFYIPTTERAYDADQHLFYMTKVFLELHKTFFQDPANANVGQILERMKRRVLKDVGIFFTGYRKNSEFFPSLAADCIEKQKSMAMDLGATTHKNQNLSEVTHVVAGKNCTNNLHECRQLSHLKKVHTLWLWSCEGTWQRAPEVLFDIDILCEHYGNAPPRNPAADHWVYLNGENEGRNKNDFCISNLKISVDSPKVDSLPEKEFLGTGWYSNGATVISDTEKVVIRWIPEKQFLRQNQSGDRNFSTGMAMTLANSEINSITDQNTLHNKMAAINISNVVLTTPADCAMPIKNGASPSFNTSSSLPSTTDLTKTSVASSFLTPSCGGFSAVHKNNEDEENEYIPFCNHPVNSFPLVDMDVSVIDDDDDYDNGEDRTTSDIKPTGRDCDLKFTELCQSQIDSASSSENALMTSATNVACFSETLSTVPSCSSQSSFAYSFHSSLVSSKGNLVDTTSSINYSSDVIARTADASPA